MRAILDPNVLISAALSPRAAPAAILTAWRQGRFELVVSPFLLDELERALAYPKLRRLVEPDEAAELVAWLREAADLVEDAPEPPSIRSRDRGDDYLLALAEARRALLVSGDDDLLELEGTAPVCSPAAFLALLDEAHP